MTDKDIIKALEHHQKRRCFECPLRDNKKSCSATISTLTHELINRQKAEIEDLQMDKEQLKRAVINANMKGEHLQAENKRLLTEFLRFKEEIAQPYLLINCDDKSVEVLRERLKNQKVISVPYSCFIVGNRNYFLIGVIVGKKIVNIKSKKRVRRDD